MQVENNSYGKPLNISVVTISFNQAEFLSACIESVAAQDGPYEHIIVDPGSTDGSREIIEANRSRFSHIIFEKDDGPADGLNRGFARATGSIYYYINSDDILLPGVFEEVREFFSKSPQVDVVSGNSYIIDESGKRQIKIWSDPVSRLGLAHGCCILIQPSTFIRKRAFQSAGGFNVDNRSCWDAELVREMFVRGMNFKRVDSFWSSYRLYKDSITGSGRLNDSIKAYGMLTYELLMRRKHGRFAKVGAYFLRAKRLVQNPERLIQRARFF